MTRLIDVMIVGVEKAGTTSLLRYLSEHPEVISHKDMEMPYFVDDEKYKKGWDRAHKEYFPSEIDRRVLLAKSVGCMYWELVPERLHAHNPDMKLIVVLRNPVERAYSAYWYALQMGREDKKTFEDAIFAEEERLKTGEDFHLRYHSYLRRGLYGRQLERLLKFFDLGQVRIVMFEDLKTKPAGVVADLFGFFALDPVLANVDKRHNETFGSTNAILYWLGSKSPILRKAVGSFVPDGIKRTAKYFIIKAGNRKKEIPPISEETRAQLLRYYEADIDLLQKLLRKDLSIWSM